MTPASGRGKQALDAAVFGRHPPHFSTGVHTINEEAFGQTAEARLVDALRAACPDALSLVAVSGGQVVGHILFTPVTIRRGDGTTLAAR